MHQHQHQVHPHPMEPLLTVNLPKAFRCPGTDGPAGQSPSLYIQVEAGSWRLLLVGRQLRGFVAHGVRQGRVILPVAEVGKHEANG